MLMFLVIQITGTHLLNLNSLDNLQWAKYFEHFQNLIFVSSFVWIVFTHAMLAQVNFWLPLEQEERLQKQRPTLFPQQEFTLASAMERTWKSWQMSCFLCLSSRMSESIDSESVNGISRVQFLLQHTDVFAMMDSESCATSAAHIHFQVAALVAVCVCGVNVFVSSSGNFFLAVNLIGGVTIAVARSSQFLVLACEFRK